MSKYSLHTYPYFTYIHTVYSSPTVPNLLISSLIIITLTEQMFKHTRLKGVCMLLMISRKNASLSHATRLLNIPLPLFTFKKRPCGAKGADVWMAERIMVGLPVSIDQTGLRTYRQLAPVGNPPVVHWGSVRLRACWLSLLSGFLYVLQKVTSPVPPYHHMDHLNGLSTKSLAIDVESMGNNALDNGFITTGKIF